LASLRSSFDVFSWKLLKGNPKTALSAPYSIVLTESTARKYFGDEDPLGKSLKGSESAGRSNAGDYTVTGVIAEIPSNSHFRFNAFLSMSTFRKARPDVFDAWGYVDFYTYFLVNEHFDETAFKRKIPAFMSRHIKDPDSRYLIAIEALRDAYLRTTAERQPGETGSLSNIYVFSIIGFFILAIAMINFMNLSTARSVERAKEDVRNIVSLLSRDFIKLVLIAVLIATPISWYIMNEWLEGFAYRMEINFWIYVLAGFVALSIAVLTISFQSVKSALMNPVSSLKSE
jgi:hypothetical protein